MPVSYEELREELTQRMNDGKSTPTEGLLVELIGSIQELTKAVNDGVRIITKPIVFLKGNDQ